MTTPAQQTLLKHASESDIQKLVVDHLRVHGYVVLETGQYHESQRKVNDNALSDLVVHCKEWPAGLNICIEMKRPGLWASTKTDRDTGYSQHYLESIGATIVCHSLEEVLFELVKFNERLVMWGQL